MSLCHADRIEEQLPIESRLLEEVELKLVSSEAERRLFDDLLERDHYLHNPNSIGRVLRYAAMYQKRWVAILTFCSASLHLKPRDRFLNWSARQVRERRHLIAQNSRFLVLPSTGRWPNLASRVLKMVCARLSEDWREAFGHPVLLAETFVDPARFRGTCYRASNWQALGQTQGFERCGQDYYVDGQHPKELWVYPLGRSALARLRAPELTPELCEGGLCLPPPPPVKTETMGALADFVRKHVKDERDPHGVRHPLAAMIAIATLAIGAGCQGPHAIAEFAQTLNHGQRRRLGCRRRVGRPRQFDVPCERTFYRLFEAIDPDQLCKAFTDWMATLDPTSPRVLHMDGKVLRNADPAPPRLPLDATLARAVAELDTPVDLQKPKAEKALTLVNFQTPEQRLVDQIAVPQDTNEEAAVAAHLPKMDLAGRVLIGDAAHTVKANCRELTQESGADYIWLLKGNQPKALAKAESLLPGLTPPLRLSRLTKATDGSRSDVSGPVWSMARPSDWLERPKSFASIAR
ncbi:MAG: Druantia anti-phage system protein DruA [Planctomycetales bacterium]